MSYTHSSGVANTQKRVEYLVLGVGKMKKEHLANGTHRVAAMACTLGSVDTFLDQARTMTAKGRKLQAYSYIQSFKNTEFDPSNRFDVQRVNDLGYELATELNPDADHLVITHVDGKGHGGCGSHPHNHIVTINDDGHGKSLQRGKLHSHVRAVNDRIMRENDLHVIPVQHSKDRTAEDQATYWADVRGKLSNFDAYLGDLVEQARNASIGMGRDTFIAELASRGVELATTEEDGAEEWSYRARDPEAPNKRLRRRKASKLADDLDAPTVSLMVEKIAPTPAPVPVMAPAETPEVEEEAQWVPVRLGPSVEMFPLPVSRSTLKTSSRDEGLLLASRNDEPMPNLQQHPPFDLDGSSITSRPQQSEEVGGQDDEVVAAAPRISPRKRGQARSNQTSPPDVEPRIDLEGEAMRHLMEGAQRKRRRRERLLKEIEEAPSRQREELRKKYGIRFR